MRTLTLVVVAVCCLPAFSAKDKAQPGAPSPVIAACLHKRELYTVTRHRYPGGWPIQSYVEKRKISVSSKDNTSKELRFGGVTEWERAFHIHSDILFSTDGILGHSVGVWATWVQNVVGKPTANDPSKWDLLGFDPLMCLAYNNSNRDKGMFGMPDFSPTKDANCGFTITAEGKLFVFLVWNGQLSLWSATLPKIDKNGELESIKILWDHWRGDKEHVPDPKPFRVVETGMKNERFFAYQDKSHWLFVTESGQVHSLPREGKDKRTESIWKDAKRPVRLLLEDNATGTTWAFAPRKDGNDKKLSDVYFPLAKKITPIDFDAKALPAWDLKKPMDMALAHARFLVKQKKVVVEEKKPALPEKK